MALPAIQVADELHVRVYGLPQAQGRPRAFKLPTGQVRVYDPASSKDWKRTVMAQVLAQRPATWVVTRLPLSVRMEFWLPKPQSAPKRRRIYAAKRPDLDNLCKGVLDALRGLVFHNDAQVVRLDLGKDYADRPGVDIWVTELVG